MNGEIKMKNSTPPYENNVIYHQIYPFLIGFFVTVEMSRPLGVLL